MSLKRNRDTLEQNQSGSPMLQETESFNAQEFLKQENNRYSNNSEAHFLVYLYDSRPNECLGNYHIMRVGELLIKNKIPTSNINKAAIRKVAITFDNFEHANKFVEFQANEINKDWRAFIPHSSLYKVDFIYDLDIEMSDEEVLAEVDEIHKSNIHKIERMHHTVRTDKERLHPSDKVKIFFKREVPIGIKLFLVYRPVCNVRIGGHQGGAGVAYCNPLSVAWITASWAPQRKPLGLPIISRG